MGCGTPAAVKKLSSAQAATMVSYEQSLKLYFAAIVGFADAQVTTANHLIDLNTRQINAELRAATLEEINKAGPPPPDRGAALSKYTAAIQAQNALAETQKAKIAGLVAKLNDKQNEMMSAFQEMTKAQQKLDEYIQLRKTNDVILDELTGILGVNRAKVDQATQDITHIATDIQLAATNLKGGSK